MSKRVDEFFDELKNNVELRREFYKIMKSYPEKEVLDNYTLEEQLKFICDVIIPFANSHGFEFNLADIVFENDIEKLGDLSLEEISGGNNFGRKLAASTLAAVNMLTFVPSMAAFAKTSTASGNSTSVSAKEDKQVESNYGDVLAVLKKVSKQLHPISEEYPVNEVDGLILSTISYLPLSFVPELNSSAHNDGITIAERAKRFFEYEKTKNDDLIVHPNDNHTIKRYIKFNENVELYPSDVGRKELLKLVAESPRYKDIKVGNFASRYIEYEEGKKDTEQFAAVTFTLESGNKIVSFRGTDGTMSGWKEDLDLAWSEKVLAQGHALVYLNKVFKLSPESDFVVVGHSKGGNLALYASFCLCNKVKDFAKHFVNVFNYDGPGLNKDIIKGIDPSVFEKTSKKQINYIPQSSLIGRIMDYTSKGETYCVNSTVQEATDILLQHDSITWNISYDYEKKGTKNKFESNVIQPESKFMADATALFVETVDRENAMRFFVQWVFDFMVRNNITMDDSRSMNQIVRDLFYNYFVKNKSIYDMINIVFSPSTAIYLSETEQNSFKNILHTTFSSLLRAYWGLHVELNKKMGLSPKFTQALENMVKSDYALQDIYKVAKVVREDVVTLDRAKSFLKKLYGI